MSRNHQHLSGINRAKHERPRRLAWALVAALAVLTLMLAACGQSAEDEEAVDVAETGSDNEEEETAADQDSSDGDATDDGGDTDTDADSQATTTETTTSPDTSEPDETDGAESTTTTALFTSTTQKPTTTVTVPEGGSEPDYDPGLAPLVAQARADLAGRLGVGEDAIKLVLAELRAWPDSSIGCPMEGMQYLQVLTDGAEFIFNAGGAQYRYTTGGQVYVPQLCEA